jgi:hypothetical protein
MKAWMVVVMVGGCAADELAQKESALVTCPTNIRRVVPEDGDSYISVPEGCTRVEIKAWGAGGSFGAMPGCDIGGNGGGGGFLWTVEPVVPFELIHVVAGSAGGNHTLIEYRTGPIIAVAAGGGRGGCKAFLDDTAGNGGAGGSTVGEDGTGASTLPPRGPGTAGGGKGAAPTAGGEGGSSTASRHGSSGERFAGGFSLSGSGGSGFYGGGGGGTIFYAGAGGGGGSSFPGLGVSHGGAGIVPGGFDDEDYAGYAVGGTVHAAAGGGAVVLRFGTLLELAAPEVLEPGETGEAIATAGLGSYKWVFFSSRGNVSARIDSNHASFSSTTPGNNILIQVSAVFQGVTYVATGSTHVRNLDVPPLNPAAPYIADVSRLGVMDGCGNGNFCAEVAGTRGAIAEWLVKAKLSRGYAPRAASGKFADVPVTDPRAVWIEELVARGVTGGCAPAPPNGKPSYCPDTEVTRAQAAVFLLLMREGPAYRPPQATGVFADVLPTSAYAPWVEEIARRRITGGCGVDPQGTPLFCPNASITRGQIAVFLVTTFGL